jgi:hypothetical protein
MPPLKRNVLLTLKMPFVEKKAIASLQNALTMMVVVPVVDALAEGVRSAVTAATAKTEAIALTAQAELNYPRKHRLNSLQSGAKLKTS